MRRQNITALFILSLAGGCWWNSTQLNETERKLVGAWMHDNQPGELLENQQGELFLKDGREFRITGFSSDHVQFEPTRRWSASGGVVTSRLAPRQLSHRLIWLWVSGDPRVMWNRNPEITQTAIVRLSENEVELQANGASWTMRRTRDPEVVRLFQHLSSGVEPP